MIEKYFAPRARRRQKHLIPNQVENENARNYGWKNYCVGGQWRWCESLRLPLQLSSVNVCAMGIFYSSLRSHPLPVLHLLLRLNISLYINLNDDGMAGAPRSSLFFIDSTHVSLTPHRRRARLLASSITL